MHSFQDAFQAKREGLVTEAVHVMFYIEVYIVGLKPSVFRPKPPAKTTGTYCVKYMYFRGPPPHKKQTETTPPDGEYHLETKKILSWSPWSS